MPFVRIDLIRGRTEAQLAAVGDGVQRALVETLNVPERDRFQAGTRPEDVAISLVESTREDWSFGNGVAQYVVLPKEEWK